MVSSLKFNGEFATMHFNIEEGHVYTVAWKLVYDPDVAAIEEK